MKDVKSVGFTSSMSEAGSHCAGKIGNVRELQNESTAAAVVCVNNEERGVDNKYLGIYV